ncbi:MAG TPA: tetratricopeptide repeat protein [Polyangia bacterium]|jgi:tetratricopeptide (TPR) repeat protein
MTPSAADARARALWTWASLGVLLLFVAGRCLQPMDETDLFYNLRLGEIILRSRAVPRTNLLSFTNGDFPDPNLAWLFQIVLALANRAGGIGATVVLKTAFVAATFALLFRVALRRGAHPVVAALALALAAWAAEPRFVERPHLVTFLGLAAVLLAIERAEAGRPKALFALVPAGLAWANGNSCFFLAPVVLALYAVGCRLDGRGPQDQRADGQRTDGRRADGRRAALVALALVPLTFATPSGSGVVGYIVNHFRMPSVRPLQEYRAAEWPVDGPFFFLAGAVAVTTLLAARAHRDRSFRHLLPIVALGLLGARRIRFVAEFALLAGPYVAAQATRQARFAPRLRRTAAALALATLAFLTWSPRLAAARAGQPFVDLSLEPGLVPMATIAWLDAHGLRDRLYNDLEVGSYLAWQGWPSHRVFQDPRINGYPLAWHAWLRRADLTRDAWDAFLARYAVRAALVSFPDLNPRAALFDPARWALVQRSGEALVFVRRDDASRALVAAEELPLTFRFDLASGTEALALEAPPALSPVPGCEWQRRLGELFVERHDLARADLALRRALAEPTACLTPSSRSEARLQAASVALERNDAERAALLLAGLDTPQARTNRGYALLALDRTEEALGELQAAAALEPDGPEARFGVGLALMQLGRVVEARAALDTFLARWPAHFAAPRARRLRNDLRAR